MEYWAKITKINNVFARLSSNHPSIVTDVYNYMNVYAKDYKFMPKYKMGIWDGKIPFMKQNGVFPIGLLKYVYKFIKQDGVKIEIEKNLTEKYEPHDFEEITNKWLNPEWVPLVHQVEGAIRGLIYSRCILEHATSSGKSLTMALMIMYNLIKERSKKILVLVPGTGLMKQLTADFESYGVPGDMIGNFYGFQKDTEQPIIISTWQSMHKQKELLKEFDMIVTDETHTLKGNVIRSVAENAINAFVRIGCTGSLPDDHRCERWSVESAIGPVVHVLKAKDLIEAGLAANVVIKILFLLFPEDIKNKLEGVTFDIERQFIEGYDPRNNIIKCIVKKHHEKDHNVLVLVEHLDHIDTLKNKLEKLGKDHHVITITGEVDPKERERIRHFVNNNKKCVIIATYGTCSTGVSIKRLHAVVFGSPSASTIRVMQSIGRGMRLHKEKSMLSLYDISENIKYSEKHLNDRIKIYTKNEFDIITEEINLGKLLNGSI